MTAVLKVNNKDLGHKVVAKKSRCRVIACASCRSLPYAVQTRYGNGQWHTMRFYPTLHEAMQKYRQI